MVCLLRAVPYLTPSCSGHLTPSSQPAFQKYATHYSKEETRSHQRIVFVICFIIFLQYLLRPVYLLAELLSNSVFRTSLELCTCKFIEVSLFVKPKTICLSDRWKYYERLISPCLLVEEALQFRSFDKAPAWN